MRLSIAGIVFVSLILSACDDGERRGDAGSSASVTADGALTLYNFESGVPVTTVDGLGRIPLGLANALVLEDARARTGPGSDAVLSMRLTAPLDDFVDPVPEDGSIAYEWLFEGEDRAWTVRLAPTGGTWALTVDGIGHEAQIEFGDRELSVRAPRAILGFDAFDGSEVVMWRARSVRNCETCDPVRVGARFPRDGLSVEVGRY